MMKIHAVELAVILLTMVGAVTIGVAIESPPLFYPPASSPILGLAALVVFIGAAVCPLFLLKGKLKHRAILAILAIELLLSFSLPLVAYSARQDGGATHLGSLTFVYTCLGADLTLRTGHYGPGECTYPTGLPSVPIVVVSAVNCSGSQATCTLTLRNDGAADATTTTNCSLTFGGSMHTATLSVATIRAGGSATVTCAASGGTASPGSKMEGWFTTANGAVYLFSGTAR